MAWQECVDYIAATYKKYGAKEIETLDWSTVTQAELDNDAFSNQDHYVLICPGRHCIDNVNTSIADHALCQCKDEQGGDIPGCKAPSALYPEKASVCVNVGTKPIQWNAYRSRACTKQAGDWYQLTCYCCCSCFAHGTRIGIPGGFRVIEQFEIGDKVLTGSLTQGGSLKLDWAPVKISFSSGTGPDSHQPAMVYIHHGGVGSIIVTPDHLFLLSTGKLRRADRLVPGKDFLVTAEGVPVAVNEVSLGEYQGGVHHIATENEFTGSVDGHLLVSEGIVSGDFMLQIHSEALKNNGMLDDHDELPKVGSEEYERAHTHLVTDSYKAQWKNATPMLAAAAPTAGGGAPEATTETPHPNAHKFYVYGQNVTPIPENAVGYLSPRQEEEVHAKAEKAGFADAAVGVAAVTYVIRLFQGFYPDFTFYHDAGQLHPNAYAFTQYGKPTIVVMGGLARIKGMGMEGLAVILAHMVSRLQKSAPVGAHGYTSVAMADYYSTMILQRMFFGGMYKPVFRPGIKQIDELLFSQISDDNDTYETDPYAPTRATRLDALDAADAMDNPPAGIGGAERGGLKLIGADANSPIMTPASFVGDEIDPAASTQVYADLQDKKIIDEDGRIAPGFGMDTDLSFLFATKPAGLETYLTEMVRRRLLNAPSTIRLNFNVPINPGTASDASDYELSPAVPIRAVQVASNGTTVTLSAALKSGTDYTARVRGVVRASNGSTLSTDSDSAAVRLP